MSSARLRELEPNYFALVMATGIVSIAMLDHHPVVISDALLWLCILEYAVLVVLHAWRVCAHRDAVAADLAESRRAFGMLTFVAASGVLGTRLAIDRHSMIGLVLLLVCGLAWLVLGYVVPWAAASGRGSPALAQADGRWFMWVVAGQSVAVLAATLEREVASGRRALALLAVFCWAVGGFLYVIAGILVATRLVRYPVQPGDFTPPYWIAMGATAITGVAGAGVAQMSASPVATAVHGTVEGASVLFWSFGTWLVPPLIAAGVWRHMWHRVPLRYETDLWSIVFPLGMYGVASRNLGRAADLPLLRDVGTQESWIALAAWLVTFLAMGYHLVRSAATARRSAGCPGAEH